MNVGRQLIDGLFLALLIGTLVVSHPARILAADYAKIAPSAEEVKPVATGDMAPTFIVRTVDNEPFVFDPQKLVNPAILISFRGGWCPFCNMHLSELRSVVPELDEMGFDVYFLSGDRPELLYESLARETQEDIDGLGYTILSDADIEAAIALGTAFRAADSTIAGRRSRGQDIAGSSMDKHQVLAVPAVYVIDTSGKVVYSFVEPDYRVRLSSDDLLQAAKTISR